MAQYVRRSSRLSSHSKIIVLMALIYSAKQFFLALSVLIMALIVPAHALAQAASPLYTEVGEYSIHHTVFNSSFLSPEIANIYDLTRGKDKAIVNVAVTKTAAGGNSLGLPVQVAGLARNLMQQQTSLTFITIKEQGATYYIAPFEFDDQEIMHFDLEVSIPGEKYPKEIRFTKKLYHD